jgi:hypothetical protein
VGGEVGSQFHGNWPPDVPTARARFDKDERITKVLVLHRDYTWARNETAPHWIAGMQVHTNKNFYDFGDTDGRADVCSPLAGEQIIGFYGRGGSYLDQLGCLYSKAQK